MITLSCIIVISLISGAAASKCPKITDIKPRDPATTNCVTSSGAGDDVAQVFAVCPEKKACPFYNYDSTVATTTLTCEDNSGASRNFPGLPCKVNTDCINNVVCNAGVCTAIADGAECTDSSQCALGSACLPAVGTDKPKCGKQSNDVTCTNNSQCLNTHGCNAGKCTEYFTLKAGAAIDPNNYVRGLSLCASGKHDTTTNKCVTRALKDDTANTCQDADTACTYTEVVTDGVAGTDKSISNTCNCPYTTEQVKRCAYGTNHQYTTDYVTKVKAALTSLNKCHGAERKYACNAYNGVVSETEFNTIIDLYIVDWLRDNGHRAIGLAADKLKDLVNVTFTPYASLMSTGGTPTPQNTNTTAQTGGNHVCPLFQCSSDKKDKICAVIGKNATADVFNLVNVSDVCDSLTETCAYPSPLSFTTEQTASYSCKARNTAPVAYAGEECTGTGQGNCALGMTCDGKCKGNSTGDACTDSSTCNIGNFCDAGKCQVQRASGAKCSSTYDCANNLFCNGGVCVAPFTVENGVTLGLSAADKAFASFVCKSGRANADNTVCVTRAYATGVTKNADGLVECQPGHACLYTETGAASTTPANVSEICTCGFNKDRKAYCPVADTERTTNFQNYRDGVSKSLDNKCHTMSRFSCKAMGNKERFAATPARHSTVDYHLYYNAVDCAEKVLGSSFLNISMALLFVIASLLF